MYFCPYKAMFFRNKKYVTCAFVLCSGKNGVDDGSQFYGRVRYEKC